MRSNYKQLGSFIRPVDIRNRKEEDLPLLGVSVQKVFITSIANTVGTDFSKYKKVKCHQFTYIPDTSRRGDKIGIAMLSDYDEALVSQAYTVFEIIDHNLLDPEYLMMWFRRPEFDRYARFKSHGSVREIFDWQELCETELPIPSISTQREIVREYNTIVNRIALNEQLIQRLEETAQAVYKRWFVEFEFPDEKGNPYKSSGGKMVWCKELEKEIPEGWEVRQYQDVFDFKTGKLNSNAAILNGSYPFFTCSSETYKTNTYSFDCEALLLAGNNASAIYPFKYYKGKFDAYQRTYVIQPKNNFVSIYQAYFSILGQLEGFKGASAGTATKFLTMTILNPLSIIVSDTETTVKFTRLLKPVFERKIIIQNSLEKLFELDSLILSKMTKVDIENEISL